MLTTEQINDLHRLYWSEHWPIRKIERHLNLGWKTIRKYLDTPAQGPVHRDRPSKLDPFQGAVAEWLEKDPGVSAAVIEQKLRAAGYQGGHSILREYVRNVRPHLTPKRAFVRMEPLAGERFEVDWGHFGALSYAGDMRKLYAFALVDAHSRMLYVEFTHSQSFGTFARCHMHAFTALGGIARQIAYDNLATAVVEHDGRLVRFLPRFLAFAREYGFFPHACNPASGWTGCIRGANWSTQPADWDRWTQIAAGVLLAGDVAATTVIAAWVLVQSVDARRRYHEEWANLKIDGGS